MDEPTNDLDIETLELLETLLVDYPGTLLLISHDRAFINQVVTSVVVYEDDGRLNEYVGGYEEYRTYKKQQREAPLQKAPVKRNNTSEKLSFNEQRELAELPRKIEVLEQEIELSQQEMAASAFYQQDAVKISDFQQQLAAKEASLATLYERWELLEGRK